MRGAYLIIVVGLLSAVGTANSATIDFETLPNDVPQPGIPIIQQYPGVSFSVSDGSALKLGRYGDSSLVAWTLQPPLSGFNSLVSGSGYGDWFAFVDDADTPGRVLAVSFTSPVASTSFELLDVDFGNDAAIDGGQERALVRAFDPAGQMVSSIEIRGGDSGTGDGVATLVELSSDGVGIARVEVEAIAWGGGGIDNVDYSQVPEPGGSLLAILIAVIALRRSTKRNHSGSER